jgi:hypothetical protein
VQSPVQRFAVNSVESVMGQQLSLPAGWASSLFSSTDPAERLSELVDDRREAFGDIRAVLDKLSAKYHFKPCEIEAAMGQVDDALGDLFYEAKEELEDEIDRRVRERGD